MHRVFSTYRFVNQPLTTAMLGDFVHAGLKSLEIFCAPQHFAFRSPQVVRELVDWITEHGLEVHALHSPTERDLNPGRESGIPISISDPERVRRLDAVDEVKRAIDVAERIPFRFLVQHLAEGRQSHDPRRQDAAFNSLEHLVVFAKQRGVTIALENTPGDLTSPSNLRHFIADTRLDLRLCFDVGHAHMEDGIESSFESMREMAVTAHLHDNHGEKDEHLLPGEGNIPWEAALSLLSSAPQPLSYVLELREQSAHEPSIADVAAAFDKLEQTLAAKRSAAND